MNSVMMKRDNRQTREAVGVSEFIIRYQRLAGYLMQRGFVLKEIRPNRKFPHLNVFVFRESDEIKQAIREFSDKE